MKFKQIYQIAAFCALTLCCCARTQAVPASGEKTPAAAYGVLQRVCGDASRFDLRYAPKGDWAAYETFEYSARDGKVTVTGCSDLAICRGVYEYLKNYAHVMLTYAQRSISLPAVLPDCPATKGGTPHEFRLYYNVCVFGYTTPYWGWERWEQEIDWMAFHGINMPLAMNGQEAVWQRVWQRRGVSQEGIDALFCGPAYAPWQRMGNINNHNGPQPQEYMRKAEELQKLCLARMRELGMSPVVPGFSGFVPREYRDKLAAEQPELAKDIHKSGGWAGFRDDQKSWWLSPKSDLFRDISVEMLREYTNTFGPQKYFLVDSFNEMAVPITGDKDEDLREYGEKSYLALKAGIEDAVWLMQGWLFSYSRSFWTHESTAAFMERVPDDKLIIIDLGCERYKGWKDHKAFYGKKWILSYIHNFGGYDGLYGHLSKYVDINFESLESKERGAQVGIGYSPEGVCQNEIVYEIMTDIAWMSKKARTEDWVRDFVTARYGAYPPPVEYAWDIIYRRLYSGGGGGHFKYQVIPQLNTDAPHVSRELTKALDMLLYCSNQFLNCGSYWDDCVDLATHLGSNLADDMIASTILAQQMGQTGEAGQFNEAFGKLLGQIDAANATRRQFLLESWTGAAAAWSQDPAAQKYYRMDARRLITRWGGHLDGYVAHHWAGLIGCYYLPRWQLFLSELIKGTPMDKIQPQVREFEENWVQNGPDGPAEPTGDLPAVLAATRSALRTYGDFFTAKSEELVKQDRGVFLGTWNASKNQILENVHFLVSNNVTKPGKYQVLVKGGGFKRPCKIAIAMNGEPVAWGKPLPIDKQRKEEARYDIELSEHSPGASYTVEIFFDPPVDGNGAEIWLK